MRGVLGKKLQIPSSNIQRSSKLQIGVRKLVFDVWNFSGAWMLVLGTFPDECWNFVLFAARLPNPTSSQVSRGARLGFYQLDLKSPEWKMDSALNYWPVGGKILYG